MGNTRIFFSVGEPSGDLHAANLIRELRRREPSIDCVGFGGPQMARAGLQTHFQLTRLAVMFLWGAVRHFWVFCRLIRHADEYFRNHQVDAVVLIDFPGFNWWVARRAKRRGIPVFYYGVPQVWAWAPWRIAKIKRWVDVVLCKLPFEATWFSKRNCPAVYVGHPYFDQLHRHTDDEDFVQAMRREDSPMLLLLPGSRDFEIRRNLPILLRSSEKVRKIHPDVRVAIGSYNESQAQIAGTIAKRKKIGAAIFVNKTQELMRTSNFCIACSGSVSLELLYYRLPTVIVYKINWVLMCLQRIFLKCKYITLVNLMAAENIARGLWNRNNAADPRSAEMVMPEFLTSGDCSEAVSKHVLRWIDDRQAREATVRRMDGLAKKYALPGATEMSAAHILNWLARLHSAPTAAGVSKSHKKRVA
jgi:lipid-A-disaccharide synthase